MKILAVLPIWGRAYVDRFINYTLPCLLAPRNFPVLAVGHDFTLMVYTTRTDAERLRPALKDFLCTFIIMPDRFFERHSGTVMKELFQRGFDQAWATGAVFAPVCADVIYSDSFFENAVALLTKDKRAVMTMGGGAPAAAFAPGPGGPPRALMKRFLAATDGGARLPRWPGHSNYPAQLFWSAGTHALVMRACHLYPVLLLPERHARMQWSHDNDLVERTLSSIDQIAFMDDSDQGFFFGLHEDGHASAAVPRPPAPLPVLEDFCRRWLSPWKVQYWSHDIVWHDGEADPSAVLEARRAARMTINLLLNIYERVAQNPSRSGLARRAIDAVRRRLP